MISDRPDEKPPRAVSAFAVVLAACVLVALAFMAWVNHEPAAFLAAREEAWGTEIAAGDVVFQDLDCGARCELIRQSTHSRYSHVGIVLEEDGERVVWEAFQPVGPTPLAEWVARGRDRKIGIYRLSPEVLARLPEIVTALRAMRGREYDGDYQWDDERIYCSELIAKAINRALGRDAFVPRALGRGAFGAHRELILRMSHGRLTEETVLVSPRDLTVSPALRRVVDELAE